ncbi:hypothetical protein EI94DRAFT_1035103 [Lactarius quietus]|nr:hypothetical protein EI94DRAFT_1035103 [Lactarius quietus]
MEFNLPAALSYRVAVPQAMWLLSLIHIRLTSSHLHKGRKGLLIATMDIYVAYTSVSQAYTICIQSSSFINNSRDVLKPCTPPHQLTNSLA